MAPTKGPVERYPLSDGRTVLFYRFGHKYACVLIHPDHGTPPESFLGRKAEALEKVAEYLKRDVLDLD